MVSAFYRHPVPISIAVLLSSAIWIIITMIFFGDPNSEMDNVPKEGFTAPNFVLRSSSDEVYSLSDFRGKAVVVNFWASWCPPCKEEIPAMQNVFNQYQDDGFVLLAVNATNQDSISNSEAFVKSNGITFPILYDKDGSVGNLYQVQAMPTTFIIDKSGIIKEIIIGGPMPEALLQIRVEKILSQGDQ